MRHKIKALGSTAEGRMGQIGALVKEPFAPSTSFRDAILDTKEEWIRVKTYSADSK
jgi:hypothetical protein